jgi:hypothetical protein
MRVSLLLLCAVAQGAACVPFKDDGAIGQGTLEGGACETGSSSPGAEGSCDPVTSAAVKIACGGPAVFPFTADTDYVGGSTRTRAYTIDLSAVSNPAPMAVYQSQRYGDFTYTLPGFGASSSSLIRLHFADTHWTTPGSRVFNVTINGMPVLTNFDIVRTVGAGNMALIESFTMPASSTGQYVIQFQTVVDAATVSAIEVGPPG